MKIISLAAATSLVIAGAAFASAPAPTGKAPVAEAPPTGLQLASGGSNGFGVRCLALPGLPNPCSKPLPPPPPTAPKPPKSAEAPAATMQLAAGPAAPVEGYMSKCTVLQILSGKCIRPRA